MNTLLNCKVKKDDLEVEYEILPIIDDSDARKQTVAEGLNGVNMRLDTNQSKIDELNKEIDQLTNHADGIDYMVAVGSGVLAGIIDSFWVGKFDFQQGKAWSNKSVNDFVMKAAKSKGYTDKRLDGAIKKLEDKFKIPSDNIWKGKDLGISARSHHLDDLAHHPTPVGLFFSILTQFTKKGYFQNSGGKFLPIAVDENGGLIGNDLRWKFECGVINWFFHLVSDMSGSSKTAGVGMGIPGPIVSLLKEASLIPGINKTGLSKKISDIFSKERFDLRSEMAVGHELGRQAVPVIINEAIVRSFYFIRRLVIELKEKQSFNNINWKKTLPFKNRTIIRMLTISTSVFTLVDLADAAVRGAISSGGINPLFAKEFFLRVNFVGLGRCAIAIGVDVYMGIKRSRYRNERMAIFSEQLNLLNAKAFYLQANVWIAAENTAKTLDEAFDLMHKTATAYFQNLEANNQSLNNIGKNVSKIKVHNPRLIEDINDILKWS
jgi:hypothetical protein